MKMKMFAALFALWMTATFAEGQVTSFLYQGKLNWNGAPAHGAYDLRISLYDAPTGGTLRGGPLNLAGVPVSNGVFTVSLNFGNAFSTVTSPTLQIEVRTNGGASYTLLTPRQPVTPSPYAIRAFAGDTVTGNISDTQLSANIPRLNANATFTGDLLIANPGDLSFGSTTRQMLNLWGSQYGIGVQANTLYMRSDNNFAWFRDGVHDDGTGNPGTGGTNLMTLDANGLLYVNAGVSVDSANANTGTYYPGLLFGGGGSGESISSQRGTNGQNRWGLDFYTGFQPRMSIANNGAVGIGVPVAEQKLDVNGNAAVRGNVMVNYLDQQDATYPELPGILFGDYDSGEVISSQRGTNGLNRWGLDFYTGYQRRLSIGNGGNVDINLPNGRIQFIHDLVPGINVTGGTIPGRMRFRNALEIWPSQDGTRAGYLDLRGTDGAASISLNGATGEATVKVITVTGGADLAEPFPMSGTEIPKGAVVVIDDQKAGNLKMSDRAYDTRVAGIVSGANGVNPGIALYQQGVLEGGQNVALNGRVYALADADSNPIRPGDLLTTSETPGHVMKVSDRDRASGAILGKAMSALEQGKGMVLVLVNLQ